MGEDSSKSGRIRAEDIVKGRWGIVFTYVGLGEYMEFTRREGPCPICGGKTRFRFLDLEGEGRHYCRSCEDLPRGVGFGFRLLMRWKECDFKAAAQIVKEALGVTHSDGPMATAKLPPAAKPRHEKSDEQLRQEYEALWESGFELSSDNAAGKYIRNRAPGLKSFPSMLRFHPALPYFEAVSNAPQGASPAARKYRKVGTFPGMLGYVQSHTGDLAVIWRWFLSADGQKAPVPEPKKAAGRWLAGDGAIRLFQPTDILGTCEGVETGLAVMAMHGIPCWPAINAQRLEKFQIPEDHPVKRLYVYGDNDEAKAFSASRPKGIRQGNASVKVLVERMKAQGQQAFVRMPITTSIDFADIHAKRCAA